MSYSVTHTAVALFFRSCPQLCNTVRVTGRSLIQAKSLIQAVLRLYMYWHRAIPIIENPLYIHFHIHVHVRVSTCRMLHIKLTCIYMYSVHVHVCSPSGWNTGTCCALPFAVITWSWYTHEHSCLTSHGRGSKKLQDIFSASRYSGASRKIFWWRWRNELRDSCKQRGLDRAGPKNQGWAIVRSRWEVHLHTILVWNFSLECVQRRGHVIVRVVME